MDPAARSRLARVLGAEPLDVRSLGGQHGVAHYRLTLADGRAAFAKIQDQNRDGNVAVPHSAVAPDAAGTDGFAAVPHSAVPPDAAGAAGFSAGADGFAAEAAGLRWLAEAKTVPVPAVLAVDPTCLVIEWVAEGQPSPAAAATFGAELAALHAAGAERFGAPWRGVIAGLPLPNDQSDSWPGWYAAHRLLPYVRMAADAGTLTSADARLLESAAARSAELAGPAEPPSRIHGDLWSGNVLWSGARAWLIDPAAHGGHRETDLAMLALFGAPYLDRVLAAYQQVRPLADGWRARVPLHQLHPLLVHVCLFGSSYVPAAVAAARAVMTA